MRKRIKQYAFITCCSLTMLTSLLGCGKKANDDITEAVITVVDDDKEQTSKKPDDTPSDNQSDKESDNQSDKQPDDQSDDQSDNQQGNQPDKPKKPAKPNSPAPSTTEQNTPEQNVPEPDTPDPVTTEQNTPEQDVPEPDTPTPDTPDPVTTEQNVPEPETPPTVDVDTSQDITQYEGYDLVWHDEFSGTTLNTNDWNYEIHDKGWVNQEWQAYVKSDDNIYLQDGRLIIKPIKTGEGDAATYTSGRINTQNKHNFTYGRFEARLKVPEGKGYLPAFWMMPADENVYGQWPRCGEIDIMEVHGSASSVVYGTIHYGNPHGQSQGSYAGADYSAGYHVFSVEWEPGKITWYVDGIKYHEEDSWYSTTEGQGTITYPAPFDQPFYLILNLAVGGSWVGYPDETTDFEHQTFEVDYVRVYQKTEGYDDSNVVKPEKEVSYRNPDETGNYIVNGNFAAVDDLTGAANWKFMTALGGEATASIVNDNTFGVGAKAIKIVTANAGTVDYSVQLVQPGVPLEKGTTYKLSFDAYAATDRKMIVDISGPDLNYMRYMADTTVQLTTTAQTFSYTFDMKNESDANARLEFNLGKTSPASDVCITNIRLEKAGTFEIDDSKKVLTDGNYIYNGSFQEGTNRLGYWELQKADGIVANYYVTGFSDGRRFLAETAGCSSPADLMLVQRDLPLVANMDYAFSFDAEFEPGIRPANVIKATINGEVHEFTLAEGKNKYTCSVSIGDTITSSDFSLETGVNGRLYIDNIRLVEDSMVKNGSFAAGMSGYEVYIHAEADAAYTVDSLSEDHAFDITINDTADQDWKIQLKQSNVTLEKGKWYRLSFKAKSSISRKLMYAIQRDGSNDDNWQPYTPQLKGEHIVDLSSDYETFSVDFKMEYDTDTKAVLSISMGAVGGTRITQQHRICIDDIVLEEIAAPEENPEDKPEETPETPEVNANENLLKDLTFTSISETGIWNETIANWGTGYVTEATRTTNGTSITYDIKNAGTEDWHVQLKQGGLPIETGEDYVISFKVSSTVSRYIKVALMSTEYDWYAGSSVYVKAGEEQTVTIPFTMSKPSDTNAYLNFSLGEYRDDAGNAVETPASVVTLSELSLVKVGGDAPDVDQPEIPEDQPEIPVQQEITDAEAFAPVEGNMIGSFAAISQDDKLVSGWKETIASWDGANATRTVDENQPMRVTYNITNPGTIDWHVQIKHKGVNLENGATYRVTMYLTSDTDRNVITGVQEEGGAYAVYGGNTKTALVAGKRTKVTYDFTMTKDDPNASYFISMGMLAGEDTPGAKIIIENPSIVKLAGPEAMLMTPEEETPETMLMASDEEENPETMLMASGEEETPETMPVALDEEETPGDTAEAEETTETSLSEDTDAVGEQKQDGEQSQEDEGEQEQEDKQKQENEAEQVKEDEDEQEHEDKGEKQQEVDIQKPEDSVEVIVEDIVEE